MTITATDFAFVAELARTKAAIILEPGKEYLVESRLTPLARKVGEPDIGALITRLKVRNEVSLQTEVIDALTTNETSWFRDRHPFDSLGQHILPELQRARRDTRQLSIWSAASSTGQEPYSIAMTILDTAPTLTSWNTRILATDLNKQVLDRARAGQYSQLEINRGLPATHLVRHFTREGPGWKVSDQLRKMITFEQHNLMGLPPMGSPFDIVFIRNVLIYFSPQTKKEVLSRLRRAMRPDGYLILGAAETALGLDDQFVRQEVGKSTVYRIRQS